MKLAAILATAAAVGSTAQGKTLTQQVEMKENTIKAIDTIVTEAGNYVTRLQSIRQKVVEAIEHTQERGPLLAMTFQHEVMYGNLMKNEFHSKAVEGMLFAVYGQNGRLWAINAQRQICYLDTKVDGADWVTFNSWNGWRSLVPYGNALVAPADTGVIYFPNVDDPNRMHTIHGYLHTISWDGSLMCGVGNDGSSCWCKQFDGDVEKQASDWTNVVESGLEDCIADGDRVLAVKKVNGYLHMQVSPVKPKSTEWEEIGPLEGPYAGALVVNGKFAVGVGEDNKLYYDELNSEKKFGKPTGGRSVEGYLKLAVTDQQLLELNANKIEVAPVEDGPLVAVSVEGKDVIYGNLETQNFRNGGSFASKFAAFGPGGILWGVDQSGNISFLDTKVKEPWLKPKPFASGNYARVTAAKNGLVALDTNGAVIYFPDVTSPGEHMTLRGILRTVTWDGEYICGTNSSLMCYCAPFDGSQTGEGLPAWQSMSINTEDCFPHGTKGTLIHKNLAVFLKPYSGEKKKRVTPAGEAGEYKRVAVSGNRLAGIKGQDKLYYAVKKSGTYRTPTEIRSVPGITSIAVYNQVAEEN